MNMKFINKAPKYAAIFLIILLANSCKKFLSKKNNDNITVPTTLADLQALLDDVFIMNSATPSFGEASATDYFLPSWLIEYLPVEYQYYYTWQPIDYFGGDWHTPAQPIYNSNLCLQYLGSMENNNQQAWNRIKGSALFYRSYYFLGLLWDYAKAWDNETSASDLGIMLRTSPDFNKLYKRSSVKECYEKIIADVKEASQLLPPLPSVATRPSKVAAFGLLARTYWSMRDYDNALLYADSCLMLKNDLMNFNNTAEVDISSNTPFKVLNRETIFYSVMNRNGMGICYPFIALVDSVLYRSYDSNDLRKEAYFRPNSGYYQYKGSYVSNPVNDLFTGIATDEIYLIRAECLIRNNQIEEGIIDLNTLLDTRWKEGLYVPQSITDRQEALTTVLEERRKELIFRGLRWIDIKRKNKEGADITLRRKVGNENYMLKPNDPYYALPLPIDLIKVTGIEQN